MIINKYAIDDQIFEINKLTYRCKLQGAFCTRLFLIFDGHFAKVFPRVITILLSSISRFIIGIG